jgi:hypothetical protein
MTIATLVQDLKDHGQDFEFYPTTPEMCKVVLDDWFGEDNHSRSYRYSRHDQIVLDIGAGNGGFLRAVQERCSSDISLHAIERSEILIRELVTFAKVVGTDFHLQSFVFKAADMAFCNPPYSEYETWASRLIKECPAKALYLIIPQRWKDSQSIADAIAFRSARVTILHSTDFLDAERRARAKVDILRVWPKDDDEEEDLFAKFFLERFGHLKQKVEKAGEKVAQEKAARKQTLVKRDGLVGALAALYDAEVERLQSNYDKAASMDAEVLRALGLSVASIISTLKERLTTLKSDYWQELFRCLDTVTKRLTSRNRAKLLDTIDGFKGVDFQAGNIYAVLCWVIEQANQYHDKQIIDVFDHLAELANIQNYASNKRVYGKGDWRYTRPDDATHVKLDYRIVLTRGGLYKNYSSVGLSDGGKNLMLDLLTVSNLLGIPCPTDDPRLLERNHYGTSDIWSSGKVHEFFDEHGDVLFEARAFLNGNLHLRLSKRLALALNVAMGKLRGWIRSTEEAENEFGAEGAAAFQHVLHITGSPAGLLSHKAETLEQAAAREFEQMNDNAKKEI